MCSRITPELVGDQLPGSLTLILQGPTKEAFSSSSVPPLGDQDIDHVSILIDSSPKIATLSSDGDKEFVHIPDVAQLALLPL